MTGWENIVFENRNKKYGAYELRKKSTKYLVTGLVLSLLFIFLFSAVLFVILNSDLFFTPKLPKGISIEAMQMADLQDFRFPEPPSASQNKTNPDLSKVLIVDSVFKEKNTLDTQNKAVTSADTANKKGSDNAEEGKGSGLSGDSLYVHVDKLPVFAGGNEALTKFLVKNLSETARKSKVRLKVVVQFTVYKTGEVREVTVISGNDPEVNKDVIRVINMLPRWEPAEQNGHPVSFRFNLPINL